MQGFEVAVAGDDETTARFSTARRRGRSDSSRWRLPGLGAAVVEEVDVLAKLHACSTGKERLHGALSAARRCSAASPQTPVFRDRKSVV